MTGDALFEDADLRVAVPELTAGERLRARQQARITHGCHPLSVNGVCIPLHPEAPRTANRSDAPIYPTCGTCRFRRPVGGHAKSFPKCLHGFDGEHWSTAVRATNGEATDVRAWWPACEDWQGAS